MKKENAMKAAIKTVVALSGFILFFGTTGAPAGQAGKPVTPGRPEAVFDFRIAEPKAAQLMLELIHKTYKNLSEENRNPNFVIVFLGPSVKLISTDTSGFSEKQQSHLRKIGQALTAMEKDGIKLEGSVLAAYFAGIDPVTFLPEIVRVDNGLVSIIDYQSASFSLVPVY